MKQKKRLWSRSVHRLLVHEETGLTDLFKLEQLVRILCDLRNQGKEVVLVSSRSYRRRKKSAWIKRTPLHVTHEAGLCFRWSGRPDRSVSAFV